MKVTDLKFEMVGCCGGHAVAEFNCVDGTALGIVKVDDLFNVTIYRDGELMGRKIGITEADLDGLMI